MDKLCSHCREYEIPAVDRQLCFYCLMAITARPNNIEMRAANNTPMPIPQSPVRNLVPWLIAKLNEGYWVAIDNSQNANLFAVTSWKNTPVCLHHAYNARIDPNA